MGDIMADSTKTITMLVLAFITVASVSVTVTMATTNDYESDYMAIENRQGTFETRVTSRQEEFNKRLNQQEKANAVIIEKLSGLKDDLARIEEGINYSPYLQPDHVK